MKSDRIYLRILEEADLPQTLIWMNDPVISDIMGYLPTKTLANQKKWFDSASNDNSRFVFAICLNDDNSHIGNVGLGNIDYIHRHCMFNIFIANQEKRLSGLGSEATKLALNFAFQRLNMNKVHLRTSARFTEAVNMYKKLGFVLEGTMREHYFTNGHFEDKLIYSILAKEYNEI